MFEFHTDESFSGREELVLSFWKEKEIFLKSLEGRKGGPLFSFYDGPPFATGLPHYGHLLTGTIKDVIPRYKTMKGCYVPRRFGWDCHGLPIENEIEKAKELSGGPEIEAFGIDRFNEECRSVVLRYSEEWKKTVERMGRWVDFEKTYKTMDTPFMESVWWVFSKLYERGLVYEGFKVMPFSMKLGTPLSNFEANLNYQEVDDPSVVVAFEVEGEENSFFLAWTTTPWTLPSNLALMVGEEIDYVKVECPDSGRFYYLAKARVSSHFSEGVKIIEEITGKELVGKRYVPLFDTFLEERPEAFRVIAEEAVSTEDGTGIVHTAPAFGELDFFACSREGIELVCPVDHNGRFTQAFPMLEGQLVKDTDKTIIKTLKEKGLVFSQKTVRHRYPFCWRSDTPLIYKAVRTWFVAVEKIKKDILASNEQIHWVPGHIKEGRFGKWLENARDWAISRNRYWGCPIPIWRNEEGECKIFSGIEELEKKTGAKIEDLHRHFIDDLTFEEEGKTYRRIPEVFDCWFESGSMPYAQNHYPFEGKEHFEENFPADFIAEGLDQTRGWFYTLTVLSSALFKKPAFKNVIVNGIILAEDGNKMSKRLKNYPDPEVVLKKFGADATRLYMLASPVVKADDLRFSEKGVEQTLRQVLIPFWNAFVFLSTYAQIYSWKPKAFLRPSTLIDQWILSKLQKLILDVEEGMDSYDLPKAVEPFVGFIEELTNWYIRRSRARFWADEDSSDRQEAFSTLYHVLKELSKLAAPFTPFLSEAIYQSLKKDEDPESVHLCDFPVADLSCRHEGLEREMASSQIAVSLGHSLRKEHKLKVRQPLAKAHLISSNLEELEALKEQKALIAEELNVKEIEFHDCEDAFVEWEATPNFPILGKKIGKKIPVAKAAIAQLPKSALMDLIEGKSYPLSLDGEDVLIASEDVQIKRKVKADVVAGNKGEITVALDTKLNEALLMEGVARDLINKINTMRKEEGLKVTDRIELTVEASSYVQKSFEAYRDYIQHEVLATKVTFASCSGTSCDLGEESVTMSLKKS